MFSSNGTPVKTIIGTTGLTIGNYIKTKNNQKISDLIQYTSTDFSQTQLVPQTFYISTPYSGGSLQWKYNPFIPIRLRYFTDSLYSANSGSTSYGTVNGIPSYATKTDNKGNFVWRNIMSEGYIDPLVGTGTDYPFINKRRYLFTSILIAITPNLLDSATVAAFEEVWFSRNAITSSTTPTGDINNIGKPCQ